MHEVLVNRLGGLSLPRKSVIRLTDRSDMTLDVYRGCKTTIQHHYEPPHQDLHCKISYFPLWCLKSYRKKFGPPGAYFFQLEMTPVQRFLYQGPVVQSIVSLTSSLRGQLVKCFTTLQPTTLIFFVEKMREAFALQKLLTFFQQKILEYFGY